MPFADPSPSAPLPKRWLPRLRFSLRTLVIGVLLVGSAGGLWWRWEPWALVWTSSIDGIELRCTRFMPTDDKLFISSSNFTKVVDTQSWRELQTLEGASHDIEFSPDGSHFLLEAEKQTLVYNSKTLSVLRMLPHESSALREHFSPSGNIVVTLSRDLHSDGVQGQFWETDSGRLISTVLGGEWTEDIVFIDDQRAATLNYIGTHAIWDVSTGSKLKTDSVQSVHRSRPDDRLSWPAGGLTMTDESGVEHPMNGNGQVTLAACLSADGTRVASVSLGGFLHVSDARTFTPISEMAVQSTMNSVEFSPNGRMIATGDKDECVRVWQRRRPEYGWGVAWLPEFWLTALFAGALGWSVWRDRAQSVRKLA